MIERVRKGQGRDEILLMTQVSSQTTPTKHEERSGRSAENPYLKTKHSKTSYGGYVS